MEILKDKAGRVTGVKIVHGTNPDGSEAVTIHSFNAGAQGSGARDVDALVALIAQGVAAGEE